MMASTPRDTPHRPDTHPTGCRRAPPAAPATSFPIGIAIGAPAGVAALLLVAIAVTLHAQEDEPHQSRDDISLGFVV